MAAITHPLLRKMLSLGSGVGIRVDESDLHVAAVRVRPRGIALLGAHRIEDFRNRPAAEWGSEYARFLQSAGLPKAGAMVLLPRHELVIRTLALPGVTDQDAPNALKFQLDGLHPYDEAEVVYEWQRIGRSGSFVVAVARREVLDAYTALFSEAGIALAGFSYSASAIFHASRVLQEPPAERLAVAGLGADPGPRVEVYGESAAMPMLSGEFEMSQERAIALASSQLRLDAGTVPVDLTGILPPFSAGPGAQDTPVADGGGFAVTYAAALSSACPHLGAPVNLLPVELRRGASRAVYIPTAVLAVVLLGLGITLLLQNRWLEKSYAKRLDAEIRRLEPAVIRTKNLDQQSAQLLQQIRDIDAFRNSARRDLDLLLELTRVMEAPSFAQQLSINSAQVNIAGEVDQAEGLLKKLEGSPLLKNLEFTSPLQRNPVNQNEMFRVRAEREAGR